MYKNFSKHIDLLDLDTANYVKEVDRVTVKLRNYKCHHSTSLSRHEIMHTVVWPQMLSLYLIEQT